MITIITDNLECITKLCRKYHVEHFYAFGSVTGFGIDKNPFGPNSDIDLLVKFEKEYVSSRPFDLFYLAEELETLLERKIDIVEEPAMRSPLFIKAVEQSKQLIYVA
jgi:predicted nucleotidyltransferase